MSYHPIRALGAVALGALALAACDSANELAGPDGVVSAPTSPAFSVGTANVGEFEVCKTYVGAVGPTVTVDWELDRGYNGAGVDASGSVQLADGQCAIVHNYIQDANSSGGLEVQTVTVTEQAVPGYSTEYQVTSRVGPNTSTGPVTAGYTASGGMLSNPDNGFSVNFINTEIFVPGGEGCTPGYWKQSQHFDSYPAGFLPTTPFLGATTGFTYDPALNGPESGFASDLTLLDALSLRGGGGVNDLIRHAAAAILNANSTGVAYGYSVGDVQDAYNIDQDKDALASANEAGCPLN